jgi:glycosyltransferase involved in cell wall biosynthesis
MTDLIQLTSERTSDLKIYAISMIRNEADVIAPFLAHSINLFDKLMIVDIQSTDGTLEAIKSYGKTFSQIELYSCAMQERYQSAMMIKLSAKAINEGADWVFFLDGDEFININNRADFQDYILAFPHDVMHMPWINLVPTKYGKFESFDLRQKFFWSGRVSPFNKVAVSSLYLSTNKDFFVSEGNHNISRNFSFPPEQVHLGLTLLHIPVRSAARLKYRLSNGIRLLATKHNTVNGEGNHAGKILELIANHSLEHERLNLIASNYGVNEDKNLGVNPQELAWPSKFLPSSILETGSKEMLSKSLGETLLNDAKLNWESPRFVKGSPVKAEIDGNVIHISSQAISGAGVPAIDKFATLPKINPALPAQLNLQLLTEAVRYSFLKIQFLNFSAWSKLIPVLYALFTVLKPRRYVELGVHNGMSFFAACQVAKQLDIKTHCVAIDSWLGDPHASFHSSEILDNFLGTLRQDYPSQHYIQSFFSDAAKCFETSSVDLLHIDGFHSYEAVKSDFETWLPKMSGSGVVIFHDINVHERGFGVWRYWEELKEKYPSFSFYHCHGLGILYVGNQSNAVLELFSLLANSREYTTLAQQYFESLGETAVELRSAIPDTKTSVQNKPDKQFTPKPVVVAQNTSATLSFWQSAKRHRAKRLEAKSIKNSGLFDVQYYMSTYPDVRDSGCDAIEHFISDGWMELRNPSKSFNTARYLLANEDVKSAGINPLTHYIDFGKHEGRKL